MSCSTGLVLCKSAQGASTKAAPSKVHGLIQIASMGWSPGARQGPQSKGMADVVKDQALEHVRLFCIGIVDLPGSSHEMVQQWWNLPGPTSRMWYKVLA